LSFHPTPEYPARQGAKAMSRASSKPYPLPTNCGLSLSSQWQVRERDDDEDDEKPELVPSYSIDDPVWQTPEELAARVSAQLNRAVRIAQMLKGHKCPSTNMINDVLYVVTGLIEEAIIDNENLRVKLLDQGPPRYG
jgi:hypothetical protein